MQRSVTNGSARAHQAFGARAPAVRRAQHTVAAAANNAADLTRRQMMWMMAGVMTSAPLLTTQPALAAKLKGFNIVKDTGDGYEFAYPFGWQEVGVRGQDVVYKDVIEPLESVSVAVTPTDKQTIGEFGDLQEVAVTLTEDVLNSNRAAISLIDAKQKEYEGRQYYEIEWTAKQSNFTRHAYAVVTVANSKFYIFSIGANERRWGKMKDKLRTAADSFHVFTVV